MHISVNPERCQGHALCLTVAPELLDFDDDSGHAVAREQTVPAALEATVRRAAASCPERAIVLAD